MKILVPCTGETTRDLVTGKMDKCSNFIIQDTETKEVKVLNNEKKGETDLLEVAKDNKINVLIVPSLSEEQRIKSKALKIEAYERYFGCVQENLELLATNSLEKII